MVRPKEGEVPYRYLTIQALHNHHQKDFQCAEVHIRAVLATHSMDNQAYLH